MSEIIRNHWNDETSDNGTDDYYRPDSPERLRTVEEVVAQPERAFPAAVYPLIQRYVGDLRGKTVCVPSSGDNIAVFGFHLLGARVTSCDIAENQIKNAQRIARQHGWDIKFLCQDSMKLDAIESETYDLVYTSNGVHVWIDDLPGMYGHFYRILKTGGYQIFFETHPMIRPFDDSRVDKITIRKLYEDVGPHGDILTYGWRTQDFVNAVAGAGFHIRRMEEFHSAPDDFSAHNYLIDPNYLKNQPAEVGEAIDLFDWRQNPWAALPQCLCICGQKPLK